MTRRGSMSSLSTVCVSLLLAGLARTRAEAREPGAGPQMLPGYTIGVPVAASPPPGIYLTNQVSYLSSSLVDADGSSLGADLETFADSLQVTWMSGFRVLGARYRAFAVLPFVHLVMDRRTSATGAPGTYSSTGFANPHLAPIDLAASLGGGLFLSAGLGFSPRLSSYDSASDAIVGLDFWSFDANSALTFLREGWHATVHVVYEINTRSVTTQYQSGHNLLLNLTATREIAGVAVGPVGYVVVQTTHDDNEGMAYGGRPADPQRLVAAGAMASTRLGPITAALVYTHDVLVRSAAGGDKLSFNLSVRSLSY